MKPALTTLAVGFTTGTSSLSLLSTGRVAGTCFSQLDRVWELGPLDQLSVLGLLTDQVFLPDRLSGHIMP